MSDTEDDVIGNLTRIGAFPLGPPNEAQKQEIEARCKAVENAVTMYSKALAEHMHMVDTLGRFMSQANFDVLKAHMEVVESANEFYSDCFRKMVAAIAAVRNWDGRNNNAT